MDELNYIYIYYLNDERASVLVQINHSFFFDPNDPAKQPNIEYVTLEACEGRLFKIEAPQGSIPYVKKWPNKILLSYHDLKELESRHNGGEG